MNKLISSTIWNEAIYKSYGFKTYEIPLSHNESINLVHVCFPTIKNLLINSPYNGYANNSVFHSINFNKDIEKIISFAQGRGIRNIELRSISELPINWTINKQYVTFIIDLRKGSEDVFTRMHTKVRTAIRKGQKSNLKVEMGKHLFKSFYNIYSTNVSRLGTPVHSVKFFNALLEDDSFNIMTVFDENKIPISSVFFTFDRSTIYPIWGGGLFEYTHLSHDSFKYWNLIEFACENKFEYFDFGRSTKNTGTYDFKKRWAAEAVQLYYYYFDVKHPTSTIKFKTVETNILQSIFIKNWPKLPISITNYFGPYLRKYIP